MSATLAFDVYGTLIDPMGIAEDLQALTGLDAPAFAAAWRQKQLEYLFRRGLGQKFAPFSVCTRQALDFTCEMLGHNLEIADRDRLMEIYLSLPPYPEASKVLASLKEAGYRCFAFSNGEPDDLAVLLDNAGLGSSLDGIVSVLEVRSYKPDPAVYAFFLENTGAVLGRTWLVSGNPFDVIGAIEVGWKAAWVRRDDSSTFDPWGVEPSAIIGDLGELAGVLKPRLL
jgi:2-haloacid dehalogenase